LETISLFENSLVCIKLHGVTTQNSLKYPVQHRAQELLRHIVERYEYSRATSHPVISVTKWLAILIRKLRVCKKVLITWWSAYIRLEYVTHSTSSFICGSVNST
jgi:hypothetical protein